MLTAIQKENTVPVLATVPQEVFAMNKSEQIFNYKTLMAIFKSWHDKHLISDEELIGIDKIIAKKYGISSSSIYRCNDLIYSESRANIP